MKSAPAARSKMSDGRCAVRVFEDARSTHIACSVDGDWIVRATAPQRCDAFRAASKALWLLKELVEERS